jgi:uncharacterized protein YjiS (DUF1127 family)
MAVRKKQMSTLFSCPPVTFVKHTDLKLPEASITGKEIGKNCDNSAVRDASSAQLRDDHVILLVIDALVALHASFRKWRRHRRTLRALADLDERQLRDIGLTRDQGFVEASPTLLRGHKSYQALSELDDTQLSNLSELGLRVRREARRAAHRHPR